MKVFGVIIGGLLMAVLIAAGIYIYRCMFYWQDDHKKTVKAGFIEKQVTLEDGSVINYAEGPANGPALLLVHGQLGAWEDYISVLPELSNHWHVFAVDCYGHGGSEHNPEKYYLDVIGDDLLWLINHVIAEPTIVSGHSSGGIISAYIASRNDPLVVGVVLEDPPLFSTEPDYFERTFAYHDTFLTIHNNLNSNQSMSYEEYYLRNCLWGKLYMPTAIDRLADYAHNFHEKHPDKPVQFFFMPKMVNSMFLQIKDYDFQFGDHFHDYSWHNGIEHAEMLHEITVPTIFIHALDDYTEDGILLGASSNEQARRAVELMGNASLVELKSGHNIHQEHPDVVIDAINSIRSE